MALSDQIKTPAQVVGAVGGGGSGGGFTPGGTTSQILLGDGSAADNVPAGAFDNLSAADTRAGVTGTAGSGKAITDDGASGLAWAGPFEPAITTLAKSKGGFGASIAAVGDGVLKFVSGVLTAVAQLGLGQGGTGVDLSATGGTTKILAQDASHVISARDLVDGDLPSASRSAAIAAKQAAITGTPTGTKFARDTGAWSAIADTDLPATSNDATISAKVAKSTATTKGDILVATASATIVRQGIGSNNQVLTADSAQTNGLKWADAPTPSRVFAGISLGKSADQAISADTLTAITFTTEIVKTSHVTHSTVTNSSQSTVNQTEKHNIRGQVVFAANGTGSYYTEYLQVLVAGTEVLRVPIANSKPGITQPHVFPIDITLPCTANDIVELKFYSATNGGSVLGATGGAHQTTLCITPEGT